MLPPELGRYRIEAELGRGAMGVVYRAVDVQTGRRVALKGVLHDVPDEDRARVEQEALATARLDHPHIVRLHAIVGERRRRWLVLDLIDGEPLSDLLERDGPLEPAYAARVARDLADALAHAHAQGVLHRDVKPSNVLVARDGRALLTDFGLARVEGSDMGLTRSGELVGTPAYMAPEQVRGERREVGPATDVYGLGATLFHLATGRPPFVEPTYEELFAAVLRAPPPPLASLRPDAPRDLDALVRRCLAKRPAERPTAAGLVEALDAFLERHAAEDPLVLVEPTRRGLPGPVALAAGVATVAVLGAVGAAAFLGLPPGRRAATSPTQGDAAPPSASTGDAPGPAESVPVRPEVAEVPQAPADPVETSAPDPPPPPAPARPPLPPDPESARDEALRLQRALRPREALDLAARASEAWPLDEAALLTHAQLLADQGRWAEAEGVFRRVDLRRSRRLDRAPWGSGVRVQLALEAAERWRAESPVEAPPGWTQLLGGRWRVGPDAVHTADHWGLGPYMATLLLREDAPTLPVRVAVEVRLDEATPSGMGSYAGLALGARASDDVVCLYLFRHTLDGFVESAVERDYEARHGAPPTVLRLSWLRGDDFRILTSDLCPPQREPWLALEAELHADRLVVRVGGATIFDRRPPRALDGHVGLLKFYDHRIDFRGLRVEPLR